jgi:CRISPR system Cascade subunit CasD
MQSWGVVSRFSVRDSGREPSKSGVIGIICAALGISREEANMDNPIFAAIGELRMGVRVLREGVIKSDFQTAQQIVRAYGSGIKDTEPSTRWYLADYDFLVVLMSEEQQILEIVQKALICPVWQVFLGRKAFVPAIPIHFMEGVIETTDTLEEFLKGDRVTEILASYTDMSGLREIEFDNRQRLVLDDARGSASRQDVPLSFGDRRFAVRRVRTTYIENKDIGKS